MRQQIRINNPQKIDRLSIEKDLKGGKLVIVQFAEEIYSDEILAELNALCLEFDENFNVRFYGHYQGSFDCKILSKLPNVKSLWVDCLMKIDNVEFLCDLKYLKRLSLGVFEISDTEILRASNFQNLIELIIGETKTKALNLKYLESYKNLNYLIISGHTKNIEVVGNLYNLEYLALNSVSKVNLSFINKLKKLKTLSIVLGGRENLDELEENKIEILEIIRVRGFNSFSNISRFKNLKSLIIEDQIQLTELHIKNEAPTLKSLLLINCKSLKTLVGVDKLINLHELRIFKTAINFEDFIKQKFSKSLEVLAFYTSKSKVDRDIKERLAELGYKDGLEK